MQKPTSGTEAAISKRKLQLCNGYLLEFDKLSRVLSAILDQGDASRISRGSIVEATGLPDRHVESLVSMGSAMGLIVPGVQRLTHVGALVVAHDVFFEKAGTLQWCHYRGAGTQRNLVWYDVFNHILPDNEPMTQAQWIAWFREELTGQYSERTLRKVVQEEVRFVVDAYQKQRFAALKLLEKNTSQNLLLRRYLQFEPAILCAMLYDLAERQQGRIFELAELTRMPGSPGLVFGIDQNALRSLVEGLHNRGWLRYETTHNLDQVRLKPGYDAVEFVRAFYEQREPLARDASAGVFDGF
ncbi:MAG: DUF4007 family protein [Spirochaetales bacterium]|nr:DUF4007 family protein [Spirochaetales bacterium]